MESISLMGSLIIGGERRVAKRNRELAINSPSKLDISEGILRLFGSVAAD
jgi:hypothetical protein